MIRLVPRLAVVLLALLFAPAAGALPMLSVDSPASVDTGDSFVVEIRISDVDALSPLNGFEFDLGFDGSLLAATSVTDGGFLLSPLLVIQNTIGAVSIEFSELTLLAAGASGDGTLATIGFDAILPGVSSLDLSNVVLSAPFGVELGLDAVVDGSVSVRDPVGAVPEPSGILLSAIGLSIVAFRVRGKRR